MSETPAEPLAEPVKRINPIAYAGRLLFSYSGRADRADYLFGLIGTFAIIIGCLLVFDPAVLEGQVRDFTPMTVAVAVFGWWTWSALLVKRLRDAGLGWWWALLIAIPGLLLFVLPAFAIPRSRPQPPASAG